MINLTSAYNINILYFITVEHLAESEAEGCAAGPALSHVGHAFFRDNGVYHHFPPRAVLVVVVIGAPHLHSLRQTYLPLIACGYRSVQPQKCTIG